MTSTKNQNQNHNYQKVSKLYQYVQIGISNLITFLFLIFCIVSFNSPIKGSPLTSFTLRNIGPSPINSLSGISPVNWTGNKNSRITNVWLYRIYSFNPLETNSIIWFQKFIFLICYIVEAQKIRQKIEWKFVHFCNFFCTISIKNTWENWVLRYFEKGGCKSPVFCTQELITQ